MSSSDLTINTASKGTETQKTNDTIRSSYENACRACTRQLQERYVELATKTPQEFDTFIAHEFNFKLRGSSTDISSSTRKSVLLHLAKCIESLDDECKLFPFARKLCTELNAEEGFLFNKHHDPQFQYDSTDSVLETDVPGALMTRRQRFFRTLANGAWETKPRWSFFNSRLTQANSHAVAERILDKYGLDTQAYLPHDDSHTSAGSKEGNVP